MRAPRRRSIRSQPASPTVVSIVGSGRSGSTLLDIILGSHPDIEGVGALHKLPRSGWVKNETRRCACGSPIHECPFWVEVYRHWTQHVGSEALSKYVGLQQTYERSRALPTLLIQGRRPTSRFLTYARMTSALYEAIRDVSGKRIIVDSSKNPIRTLALLSNPGLDVRVIHLVRDGRGVVWSRLKSLARDVDAGVPDEKRSTPTWRTSYHWVLANLESEWVARRAGPGKARRVRYETFMERPREILLDLAPAVGADLGHVAGALADGGAMQAGHRVGGNRVRLSGSLVLRPDYEWMRKLPAREAARFWRLSGWLAGRYGYTR